jgi:hypothetical protein
MLDFDESARIMYYKKIRSDYFDHLCETEAGEYIFKTVDNVEGIYQMLAMPRTSDDRSILNDIYRLEDPADLSSGKEGRIFENFVGYPARGFRFFENSYAHNLRDLNAFTSDMFETDTDNPGWNKIHQYYGHGEFLDMEFVANSGWHVPPERIFVEDLPLTRSAGILELFLNSQTSRDLPCGNGTERKK